MDLSSVCGLPIALNGDVLVFGAGLPAVAPSFRLLDNMRTVLQDKGSTGPERCYSMYRNVHIPEHAESIRRHRLRFDLTVISPGMLGSEFMKTFGHYHPLLSHSAMSFPEVYAVLHGEANYLLQRGKGKVVDDFVCIRAKAGDKVVMPPNYGHVTVNPGEQPLVMANWVSSAFSSLYDEIGELGGFAYFECKDGFQKNTNYNQVPPLRNVAPRLVPEFGLTEQPIYLAGIAHPERLDFLNNPEKYLPIFERLLV